MGSHKEKNNSNCKALFSNVFLRWSDSMLFNNYTSPFTLVAYLYYKLCIALLLHLKIQGHNCHYFIFIPYHFRNNILCILGRRKAKTSSAVSTNTKSYVKAIS